MKDYIKINEKVYDALSGEYKKKIEKYRFSDEQVLKPFIDCLIQRVEKPKFLELGPGSGLALYFFKEAGFETTAIDVSSKIIEVARETSPTTHFIHSDFLSHDFGSLKYDGIFAKAFIHLFPKPDAIKVLNKIHSLLSDKGIAFIGTTVHDKPSEGFFEKEDYELKLKRYRKKWTEKELTDAVKSCDFNIISTQKNSEEDLKKIWIGLILERRV